MRDFEAMAQALLEFNIDVKDEFGRCKPLPEVINIMADLWDNYNEKEQRLIKEILFAD